MSIRKNKMNFSFTLSLEQRTLANIAITLWNQDAVRDLMSKSALHVLHENWKGIEKAVIEKSLKLQLPKRLNDKLLGFIGRVGFQILSWVDFHHCNYSLVTELPTMFIWTSLGTINNIKTAKLLLKSGTLDYDMKYALACMYCLKKEIKYYFKLSFESTFKFKYACVTYWNIYMSEFKKKKLFKLCDRFFMIPHTSFILDAIEDGNEAATRYFFNIHKHVDHCLFEMLSHIVAKLKLFNLEKVASLQRYSGIMMFLLSKMNAEEQANMILNHTFAVLKCLLVWPRHSLFLEMSKDKWNSLSKNEYRALLHIIVHLMCYDHNLHQLFGEFWQQSSEDYKQFLTDQGNIVHLLIGLYKRRDVKNIKLISKGLSILTKKNIFKIESESIFLHLISSKKWDLIELLIQECLSSRKDLMIFRDVFKNHVQQLLLENEFFMGDYSKFKLIEKYQWNKFFQLVDGYISRYNKRKRCTEDNNSSSKRNIGV